MQGSLTRKEHVLGTYTSANIGFVCAEQNLFTETVLGTYTLAHTHWRMGLGTYTLAIVYVLTNVYVPRTVSENKFCSWHLHVGQCVCAETHRPICMCQEQNVFSETVLDTYTLANVYVPRPIGQCVCANVYVPRTVSVNTLCSRHINIGQRVCAENTF